MAIPKLRRQQQQQQEFPTIQLVVFEQLIKLNHQQRHQPQPQPQQDYAVTIHNMDQLRQVQSLILSILNIFLIKYKSTSNQRLLLSMTTTTPTTPTPTSTTAKTTEIPSGYVDMIFPPSIIIATQEQPNKTITSLLIGLKTILLSGLSSSSSPSPSESAAATAAATATAIDILTYLYHDWNTIGHQSLQSVIPTIIDTTIVVARAIHAYYNNNNNNIHSLFQKKLIKLVNEVTNMLDSLRQDQKQYQIESIVLPTLLDCLPLLASKREPHQQEQQLQSQLIDVTILKWIHSICSITSTTSATTPSLSLASMASNHCISHGYFKDTFGLLLLLSSSSSSSSDNNDGGINDVVRLLVIQITTVLLVSTTTSSSTAATPSSPSLYMLDNVFRSAFQQHEKKLRDNAAASSTTITARSSKAPSDTTNAVSSTPTAATATSSSKRTRSSTGSATGAKSATSPMPLDLHEVTSTTTSKRRKTMTNKAAASSSKKGASPSEVELNPTTTDNMIPSLWYDGLNHLLRQALHAGRKLYDIGSGDLMGNTDTVVVDNVILVSSTLQLIINMIRHLGFSNVGSAAHDANNQSMMQMASVLCSSLSHICNKMALAVSKNKVKTKNTTTTITTTRNVNTICIRTLIGCGLDVSFFFSSKFNKLDGDFDNALKKQYEKFLDSTALLALVIMKSNPDMLRQEGEGTCHGDVIEERLQHVFGPLPDYLTRDSDTSKENIVDDDGGILNEPAYFLNSSDDDGIQSAWKFDASTRAIQSLSVYTKAILLMFLRPISSDRVPGSLNRQLLETCLILNSPTLDMIATQLSAYVEGNKISTTGERLDTSTWRLLPLLHLLPLLLVISMNGNDDKPNSSDVFQLIRKFAHLLIQSLDSSQPIVTRSLLTMIVRFHTMFSVDGDDPYEILKFMSARCGHLQDFSSPHKEFQCTLDEMILSLTANHKELVLNSQSKYMLWMLAAFTCLESSPSKLRRILGSGTVNREQEKQSSNEDLFTYLVTTPFSDSNRMVRELTSNEVSTMLMADQFKIILTRYTADDEFHQYCTLHWRGSKNGNRHNEPSEPDPLAYNVVDNLFKIIDELLKQYCGFTDSQLSLTHVKSVEKEKRALEPNEGEHLLAVQQNVSRMFASVCSCIDIQNEIGRVIFEKSFLRLIRMWSTPEYNRTTQQLFPDLVHTSSGKAFAFGVVSGLAECHDLTVCLSKEIQWTYFPGSDLF